MEAWQERHPPKRYAMALWPGPETSAEMERGVRTQHPSAHNHYPIFTKQEGHGSASKPVTRITSK